MRKEPLVIGQIYHIFTKSISGFKIFNNDSDYSRIIDVICYYLEEKTKFKFSQLNLLEKELNRNTVICSQEKLVEIIAYCIMPTHVHLLLKQIKEDGISTYMRKILDSYTRYFNIKYHRKGPLWEGRFKNVLIKTDEQLLHLTRYMYLNPVTAYLVNAAEEWLLSSYQEYLSRNDKKSRICNYEEILDINPFSYKKFVEDRISYQRELAKIKDLLLEES